MNVLPGSARKAVSKFQEQFRVATQTNSSGEPLVPLVIDQRSGEPMETKEIKLAPGPGFPNSKEALRRRFGIE